MWLHLLHFMLKPTKKFETECRKIRSFLQACFYQHQGNISFRIMLHFLVFLLDHKTLNFSIIIVVAHVADPRDQGLNIF